MRGANTIPIQNMYRMWRSTLGSRVYR